ncbi:hypothetical protein GQ54DRAFT_158330 [Martensiomyces pterosporus]|nr:hypothetical protein GQ54DRAFT_158330 [Martensiomyces pterosporus]
MAVALQRSPQSALCSLLDVACYISTKGSLNVVVRGQQLGQGWSGNILLLSASLGGRYKCLHHDTHQITPALLLLRAASAGRGRVLTVGKAILKSHLTQKEYEAAAPVELQDIGSVFCYKAPPLLEEWTISFYLLFNPSYNIPEFVHTPIVLPVDSLQVDVLDAILPPSVAIHPCSTVKAQPNSWSVCACEIWIRPEAAPAGGSACTDIPAVLGMARGLLASLLLGNTLPQTLSRVKDVLLDSSTAEFRLPLASTSVVTIISTAEPGRIVLCIKSACPLSYVIALAAIARRLTVLLDIDHQSTPGGGTGTATATATATATDDQYGLPHILDKYSSITRTLANTAAADGQITSIPSLNRCKDLEALNFADFAMVSINQDRLWFCRSS